MERAIGETFILKGERYMVCEHTAKNVSHCLNCAFSHVACGVLGLGECGRKYRADNKNVFFYKIVDDKENENMDKKIDLTELLKDCPRVTEFFSNIFGTMIFERVHSYGRYPVEFKDKSGNTWKFTKDGKYATDRFEDCDMCVFPSKEQRDWSKFKVSVLKPVEKFDYSILQPFDRVLVRDADRDIWRCNSFTCFDDGLMVCDERWEQGIPYNHDTKQLAGTTDMPDEKYVWWEES